MKQIFSSLWWYIRNPSYYNELFYQVVNTINQQLSSAHQQQQHKETALIWCAERAVDTTTALFKITGTSNLKPFEDLYPLEFAAGKKREQECPLRMGGAGDLSLLYHLAEHVRAFHVLETGVAYGWSSLAILISLLNRSGAHLISTDKPYPGRNNENYVGCVIPENLKEQWTLLRHSDRKGVPLALDQMKTLELCHYDSDKSYAGRMSTYPPLWDALRKGGIFISDDIGDNLGFHDFCQHLGQEPIIVKTGTRYVGILLKN